MATLTIEGIDAAEHFIRELSAKRKEILDAGLDTAEETPIPNVSDIAGDIESFLDPDGYYINNWGATDHINGDNALCLEIGKHFLPDPVVKGNILTDWVWFPEEKKYKKAQFVFCRYRQTNGTAIYCEIDGQEIPISYNRNSALPGRTWDTFGLTQKNHLCLFLIWCQKEF